MNLEKSVNIQDIESVLFGTEHGVLSWRPTERTKSRAISCGEIFSTSKNSKSLVLSQKNGVFEWDLESENTFYHPAEIKAITAGYQDRVISACGYRIIIWEYSHSWRPIKQFELATKIRPLSFIRGFKSLIFCYFDNGMLKFYLVDSENLILKTVQVAGEALPSLGQLINFSISKEELCWSTGARTFSLFCEVSQKSDGKSTIKTNLYELKFAMKGRNDKDFEIFLTDKTKAAKNNSCQNASNDFETLQFVSRSFSMHVPRPLKYFGTSTGSLIEEEELKNGRRTEISIFDSKIIDIFGFMLHGMNLLVVASEFSLKLMKIADKSVLGFFNTRRKISVVSGLGSYTSNLVFIQYNLYFICYCPTLVAKITL